MKTAPEYALEAISQAELTVGPFSPQELKALLESTISTIETVVDEARLDIPADYQQFAMYWMKKHDKLLSWIQKNPEILKLFLKKD